MTQTASSFDPDTTSLILQDIRRTFGMVPNLFLAYAKHPALLEANWNKVKAVLLNGVVRRQTKEIIALLVSLDNSCTYCVVAHTVALKSMGIKEQLIVDVLLGRYPPELTTHEVELVKFARKVNQHWREISDKDVEILKQMGIAETDIVETVGVVELFAGFNRFARVMEVEEDFPDAVAP